MIENVSKIQLVPRLCETRWTVRVNTILVLMSKYKCVKEEFEDTKGETRNRISKKNRLYNDQSLSDIHVLRESSDSDARLKAGSHLRIIQSSQFIVVLVVTQHILSYTRPLSQTVQKANCGIVKACVMQTLARKSSENREDSTFRNLWGTMEALADLLM